ncbi:phosphatase PAP2 family protein [Sulfurimonas sp.]|uniref:phosphatase PAP2 family protein n=1 Tax=Sulfurimonas sp. TaxID=2022749 RepID=UPI0025D3EE1B|nr:phosphatase PAP2 family protein [Sulfurimonas sp.]
MVSIKSIFITLLFLAGAIIFFGLSGIDVWVQSHFYNSATHLWIVTKDETVLKFLFYDGIKFAIIIFNVLLLFVLIFGYKKPLIKQYRRALIIIVASVIFVPFLVGSLKDVTNMPCPKNLVRFGGDHPDTCVWKRYSIELYKKNKIKCWPAGHASGGFALLSLVFLFGSFKRRAIAATVAMSIGWSMGIYKMLIGDHFLSHTIITMIMAWLIILCIVRLVDYIDSKKGFLAR